LASHLIYLCLQGYSIPDKLPQPKSGKKHLRQNKNTSLRDLQSIAIGFKTMVKNAKRATDDITIEANIPKLEPNDIIREKSIGEGTFAKVYKGLVGDEIVAIKDMMNPSKNEIEMWKKEVRLMAGLKDLQYLVNIKGYSYDQNVFTIVMEFMDQGSLYHLMHHKKVQWSMLKKVRTLRHIAKAIKSIHDVNLLHRDMKSMNVLVNSKGIAKLADWGCSRAAGTPLEELTIGVGSPMWMAPEVLTTITYSFPSDIYGFGIIIFEVLNEQLPQYDKKRKRALIPPVCIGKQLCDKITHDRPEERPNADWIVEKFDNIIVKFVEAATKTFLSKSENKEYLPPAEDSTTWYNTLLKYDKEHFDSFMEYEIKELLL